MTQSRLAEMERRMVRNMVTLGIGMLVAGPLLGFFAPFGFVIGPVVGVLGILSIVRASMLSSRSKNL
jgi:hypothetical protein